MRGSKSSDFRRSIFKLKIQLSVFTKNLAKELVSIAKSILKLKIQLFVFTKNLVKSILKLDDSQGKTLGR
jgi:hypothetical protein